MDRSTKFDLNRAMRLVTNKPSSVTLAPRPPSPCHGRLNQNLRECPLPANKNNRAHTSCTSPRNQSAA
eukprot:11785239-Alexandrium_andersonii.AAC.1